MNPFTIRRKGMSGVGILLAFVSDANGVVRAVVTDEASKGSLAVLPLEEIQVFRPASDWPLGYFNVNIEDEP